MPRSNPNYSRSVDCGGNGSCTMSAGTVTIHWRSLARHEIHPSPVVRSKIGMAPVNSRIEHSHPNVFFRESNPKREVPSLVKPLLESSQPAGQAALRPASAQPGRESLQGPHFLVVLEALNVTVGP